MSKEEAIAWLQGQRSMCNSVPHVSDVSAQSPGRDSDASRAGAAPDQCPHGVPYRWNCETCDAAPAQEADIVERLRDQGINRFNAMMRVREEAGRTIKSLRQHVAELSGRISEMNMHQQLQDSTTAAVLERAEKAEAERDELREDAKRYRWLRDKCPVSEVNINELIYTDPNRTDDIIDAMIEVAIDAARKS